MLSLVRSPPRTTPSATCSWTVAKCQQALFENFVRLDARTRSAVVGVSGSVVIANSHAQSLFTMHFQQAVTVQRLRRRIEDLPAIIAHVLCGAADRRGHPDPATIWVIAWYGWPRDIRELEETLRSALLKRPVGELQSEDLPAIATTPHAVR